MAEAKTTQPSERATSTSEKLKYIAGLGTFATGLMVESVGFRTHDSYSQFGAAALVVAGGLYALSHDPIRPQAPSEIAS